MSYDPIHDNFTGNVSKEVSQNSESSEQNQTVGTSSTVEMKEDGDQTPLSNTLSISNLIGGRGEQHNSANTSLDLENDTDGDAENEEDADSKGTKKRGLGRPKKTTNVSIPKGVRHLKKADGEPFWRKDIQYDFLKELFDDKHAVFTNSFPHCDVPSANNSEKLTFLDLYVRTLAESSKCSKILKERLLKDSEMGKSVGKVCLLVNAGRMNTTINFVPEMRSSLRTYHSIPSLQADPVFGGSKPLQDTPRLKSILKAVCDTKDHYKSLDDILKLPSPQKPNTNVIELIFLMSGSIKGIKYHLDHSVTYNNNNNSFMEFFLNSRIQPQIRAKRFLWLLYTYLETSFTPEELAENPFNPNVIPPVEYIPDEKIDEFDKDTDFEIEYSEKMYQTRLRYLADEEHNSNPKRGNKSKKERDVADPEGTFDENADTSIEPQLLDTPSKDAHDGKKRPLPLDDNKSRKRRGKRNPAVHNTIASSPLTKSVITFPIDHSNKKPQDLAVSTDLDATEYTENGDMKTSDSVDDYLTTDNSLIRFPIEGLERIAASYFESHSKLHIPDDSLSLISRTNIINKSKQIIRQVRNSSKSNGIEFLNKVDLLKDWLFRFFQYKKSTANGLLGMEWEDIRYDFINGVESYTYQQLGKSIGNGPILTGTKKSDLSNDISGQMDLANVEEIGHGYIPIHTFNRGNEKTNYMLDLISFCNGWLLKNAKSEYHDMKFDLENDIVHFS
ncbi:uncharacterized protein PRCAT00005926001 [Priceomyces carsonii]|uniref:uncharacterized protein n=1 Tax=Priceomyces carsonii TaxID=28549 RepID=UPI002EDA8810|nr:unnamed protein product [Priceomyces carsonii]